MSTHRPNEEQVQSAIDILSHHNRTYGGSGAEGSKRRAVYSIAAALGFGGSVSAEYANFVPKEAKNNTSADDAVAVAAPTAEETTDNLTKPEDVQQFGGAKGQGGDTQVHPEGRPGGGNKAQSWPPTGDDLQLFTREQLMTMTVPELVDYAVPANANIEGYNEMSHDELVEALYAAVHGSGDADEDTSEDDDEDGLTETDFEGMTKKELVKAYGKSHSLDESMTRDQMHDALFE